MCVFCGGGSAAYFGDRSVTYLNLPNKTPCFDNVFSRKSEGGLLWGIEKNVLLFRKHVKKLRFSSRSRTINRLNMTGHEKGKMFA